MHIKIKMLRGIQVVPERRFVKPCSHNYRKLFTGHPPVTTKNVAGNGMLLFADYQVAFHAAYFHLAASRIGDQYITCHITDIDPA